MLIWMRNAGKAYDLFEACRWGYASWACEHTRKVLKPIFLGIGGARGDNAVILKEMRTGCNMVLKCS